MSRDLFWHKFHQVLKKLRTHMTPNEHDKFHFDTSLQSEFDFIKNLGSRAKIRRIGRLL